MMIMKLFGINTTAVWAYFKDLWDRTLSDWGIEVFYFRIKCKIYIHCGHCGTYSGRIRIFIG